MRKLLCGLLALALAVLLPLAALAESEDYAQQLADKEAQIADLQAENEALQTRVEALEAQLAELTLEPEPTPEPAYTEPVMPEPVYAEPPAPEPVYAAPEMPEPAPAAARRCAYCGSELEPDAAFCSECGHPV